MASKVTNLAVFSVVLLLILGSNPTVRARAGAGVEVSGDPGAAPGAAAGAPGTAAGGPAAGGAGGASGDGSAADSEFADQSGVMDLGAGVGLGAGAPARRK